MLVNWEMSQSISLCSLVSSAEGDSHFSDLYIIRRKLLVHAVVVRFVADSFWLRL